MAGKRIGVEIGWLPLGVEVANPVDIAGILWTMQRSKMPDELVLISWFTGGEVFRSGCTFRRGAGRIFYFRPGHETCPTYHHPGVQTVLRNGVHWVAPTDPVRRVFGNAKSLE